MITIVLALACSTEGHGPADLSRFLDVQARWNIHERPEALPRRGGQHKPQGVPIKCPGTGQDAPGIVVDDLATDIVNQWPDSLVKNLKVRVADESRVPDMHYTVNRLVSILNNKSNEEHYGVANHDI